MLDRESIVGGTIMVIDEDLAKKVKEQEEENRVLRERLEYLENKLDQVESVVERKGEEKEVKEEKDDDETLEDKEDRFLEQEKPFIKALQGSGGSSLDMSTFNCKMETKLVLEWI